MHYEVIVRDERPPLVCTGQERIFCIWKRFEVFGGISSSGEINRMKAIVTEGQIDIVVAEECHHSLRDYGSQAIIALSVLYGLSLIV